MATLLLIEDADAERAAIRAAVEASGLFDHVVEAGDGVQGLRLLMAGRFEMVLCDLGMPGLDGEKLLAARNASAPHTATPLLVITASGDLERRARLLEQGACDVLTKPFHAAELTTRLALHRKLTRLEEELAEKSATLARTATDDALTGLRSRRYVREFLGVEVQRAQRTGTSMALVLADVDGLDRINESHGHPAGDAVLCGVADLLRRGLRHTDAAGRYGGDEILLVLAHNDAAGARTVAERWRGAVAGQQFGATGARATLSAGVAGHIAGVTPEALLAAAARELGAAKQGGGDRVEGGAASGS